MKSRKFVPQNLLYNYFQIMWRVIAITVSVMAILGGGGYLLDKYLGKFPLFMVIGLLLAFPLVQIIVYKVFTKLTKQSNGSTTRKP